MNDLYFHWVFPLSARETSSGNRSIYKSSREGVDTKGLYGKWSLHLMGFWKDHRKKQSKKKKQKKNKKNFSLNTPLFFAEFAEA